MKRLIAPLVGLGLLASAAAVQAESYTRYSYADLYATPHHSGYTDYLRLGIGTFTSDLESKAAQLSFGWQRNLPSGLGYGVNLSHSLSSSVTEFSDNSQTDLRYISLAPFVSGEIGIYRIDSMTTLRAYGRLGVSIVKPEGTYGEAVYDDIEYGAYYGAGLTMPFADYASIEAGFNFQDPIDVVEFATTIRFLF